MGFDSFRVELRGGHASPREANEAVQQLPHAHSDSQSIPVPGSTYYLIEDGQHVLEVECLDSPVRLSCRFTLCHPPSVDSAFLGLLRDLMTRLGMEVKVRDDVRPEHSRPFSLDEFAEFSAVASRYIAARRAEWVAAFGDEPLAATTPEVFRRVILPRCQPAIAGPIDAKGSACGEAGRGP